MRFDDRVHAIADFGFTERQARFLVTVMLHTGVCLPRQYEAFAAIVHGKRTGRFFRKLIKHGYAAAYPCRHNRGRVYHVHHKAERFMPGGAAHGGGIKTSVGSPRRWA